MSHWQPSASTSVLRARAVLLSSIRAFFQDRDVLEVETPILAHAAATDIHIQSWQTENSWGKNSQPLFLQTSPEFAMKRLLCAGSGPIFQIAKAFRLEEKSPQHNPEFTMLEWYRPGFSLEQLMDEVEALIGCVLGLSAVTRFSYQELFNEYLGIDPHSIELESLKSLTKEHIDLEATDLDRNDYLQLLLAQIIEPKITGTWFLSHYPTAQAALARIAPDKNGVNVAQRFELFCNGMEIANGYHELADAQEQKSRFIKDLESRQQKGLEVYPMDENLIAALASGLPDCSGVALGVDRLLMLALDASNIDEVLSFPIDRA